MVPMRSLSSGVARIPTLRTSEIALGWSCETFSKISKLGTGRQSPRQAGRLQVASWVWLFLSRPGDGRRLHRRTQLQTSAGDHHPTRLHWSDERCRYGQWRDERLESRPTTGPVPQG